MKKIAAVLLFLFISVPLFAAAFPYAGDLTAGAAGGDNESDIYADLLLPLAGSKTSFLFLSPRISMTARTVLDSPENEFNAGIGYRKYFDYALKNGFIAGVNLYYDNRTSDINKHYNQIGGGIELLSDYVDFRANYYLPVGVYRNYLDKSYNVFENHNIAATYYYELAASGFDAEIGYRLPLPDAFGEFRVYGGYYYFEAEVIDKQYGGFKAGAEYRPLTILSLNYRLYQDKNLTGSGWQAGAALSVPFDFKAFLQAKNPFGDFGRYISRRTRAVQERIGESVKRDMRIRVYKESHKRFDDVVLDEDGQPYYFTAVSPDGNGDGTFAHPASVSDGALISKAADVNTAVLFFEGGEYYQSVSVDLSGHKAKNVLIAGPAELAQRGIDVTAVSNGNPVINAESAVALFTLNGVSEGSYSVTAIEFEGGGKGATGFEVSSSSAPIYFGNNRFSGFDTGIKVNDSQQVFGYNNIISSNSTGVHISGGAAAFEQNIFYGNTREAVFIDGADGAKITSNLIDSNETGITVNGGSNSRILNNRLTNNKSYAVSSSLSSGTVIDSNIISSNTLQGIYSFGDTQMQVSNNDISFNSSDGLYMLNSSGAFIAQNAMQFNGGAGVFAQTFDYGTISGNDISSNTASAVKIDGAHSLEVSDNNITFNGLSGIDISNASGVWVDSNTVDSNKAGGISLSSVDSADVEENIATNNEGNGMYFNSISQSRITDNFVSESSGDGIYMQKADGVYVAGNTSSGNENGISFLEISNSLIDDNSFANNKADGIYVSTMSGSNVTNNIVEGSGQNGGTFNSVSDTYFSGNTFAFSSNIGVAFYGISESTFTGNRITLNESDGITLTDCVNLEVSLNTVDRNNGGGIISLNSNGVSIASNNIFYNAKTGISITGGTSSASGNTMLANNEGIRAENAQSVSLLNNEISSCTAGGIYVFNVSTASINGNYVYGNSGYGGIYIAGISSMTLRDNTANNNSGAGITVIGAGNSYIAGNQAENNGGSGIYIDGLTNSTLYSNSVRRNAGYGMILANSGSLNLQYNGFYYDAAGGGLNIINSSGLLLNTNFFQSYDASAFYGLYLNGSVTFNTGTGSGNNQFINSNYGGDAGAVQNYETGVKPNDSFM